MSAAERVYRVLLHAYPREFRAAYGREMALAFRDRRREAGASGVRFWAETAWDVARSAPALRLEASRGAWETHTRTGEAKMMAMAIVAIVVGALELAGGLGEVVVGGLYERQGFPLVGGAVGAVAGALLLAAGIALLRRTPGATALARGAAFTCLPVFVLIGFVKPLMGGFALLLGLGFPLVLLLYLRWTGGRGARQEPGMA